MKDLTDLEINKLCAEAMGHAYQVAYGDVCLDELGSVACLHPYDPLHNDTHAMALVKKIGIDIVQIGALWEVGKSGTFDDAISNNNLNRAICECVAKMQLSKAGKNEEKMQS